jgi:hypothetical protein
MLIAIASLLNSKAAYGQLRRPSGIHFRYIPGSARRLPVLELPERQVLYTRRSCLPSGITS